MHNTPLEAAAAAYDREGGIHAGADALVDEMLAAFKGCDGFSHDCMRAALAVVRAHDGASEQALRLLQLIDDYGRMMDRAEKAEQRIAELERDAARLDWLIRRGNGVEIRGESDCGMTIVIYNDGNRADGSDLREAIDAARAQQQEEGGDE